jgi:hypothetical protein
LAHCISCALEPLLVSGRLCAHSSSSTAGTCELHLHCIISSSP